MPRIAMLGIALAWLAVQGAHAAQAPVTDLGQLCALDPLHPPDLWRVSARLGRELWALRLSCQPDGALRIAVHPGDAYEARPGSNPTERVEIQIRRELVKFDQPIWYRFRFRLVAPWRGTGNRTVIHQVKQDIEQSQEIPRGPCPSANPFFKIEAGATATGADFVVKARGTADCRDGLAPMPICGPWQLEAARWYQVHVLLRPSQREGASTIGVWLDGRGCPPFTGRLGYLDHGRRDAAGRPIIDAQPRFGIYRDALPDVVQAIEFADLAFWTSDPTGDPAWAALERADK